MKCLLLLLLLAASAVAQAKDEHTASVGMRANILELVLPGTELVVAPAVREAPVVLRILATRAHGDRFRYDLEWTGLEPGSYDLTKYLVRKDGTAVADVPAVPVTVTSLLPKGEKEPTEQDPQAPPRVAGYRTLQIAAGVLWGIGLLAILFVGRKRHRAAALPPAKPTLADRLRPIVEAVASGTAEDAQKAELERLLVAFWRERLGLRDEKAAAAIIAIRQHQEAGQLMRQIEAWLHMPTPPASLDLQAVLAPYRTVSADRFDRAQRLDQTQHGKESA